MSGRIFPTPQDAENAFYEALAHADLEGMMAVWAEDEEIVCIHPAGTRLAGHDQVRSGWARLFQGAPVLSVQVSQQVAVDGPMYAVHCVQENIAEAGDDRARHPMHATNVYLRTAAGWRMIVHHSSPAPAPPEKPQDGPKTLH